jgi:putative transposase
VVENLAIKNMVKHPKLSQAISDVSWGEITRQLAYKCCWYGRNYIEIDRWFPSSKRCSNCGYIAEKMPLNVREWDCPDCGTHHDRDINASKNILAAGLAVSVCRATWWPEQSKSVKAGAKNPLGKRQKLKSWGLGIAVRFKAARMSTVAGSPQRKFTQFSTITIKISPW